MQLHLVRGGDAFRTVYVCDDSKCEVFGGDEGHDAHAESLPLVGWIEQGRKFHNGQAEFQFVPNGPFEKYPVRLGNYAGSFQDAKDHVMHIRQMVAAKAINPDFYGECERPVVEGHYGSCSQYIRPASTHLSVRGN